MTILHYLETLKILLSQKMLGFLKMLLLISVNVESTLLETSENLVRKDVNKSDSGNYNKFCLQGMTHIQVKSFLLTRRSPFEEDFNWGFGNNFDNEDTRNRVGKNPHGVGSPRVPTSIGAWNLRFD